MHIIHSLLHSGRDCLTNRRQPNMTSITLLKARHRESRSSAHWHMLVLKTYLTLQRPHWVAPRADLQTFFRMHHSRLAVTSPTVLLFVRVILAVDTPTSPWSDFADLLDVIVGEFANLDIVDT